MLLNTIIAIKKKEKECCISGFFAVWETVLVCIYVLLVDRILLTA